MLRTIARTAYRGALDYIYARRRYKLLLREGLPSIQKRNLALGATLDHFGMTVRPIRVHAPFGDHMLVIAPHQDDEVIGCGGIIALQIRAGKSVHITMMQDGADDHSELGLTREALCTLRNAESAAAAKMVGADISFLNIPDLRVNTDDTSARLQRHISDNKIDVICTPWLLDSNNDHNMANTLLANALKGIQHPVRLFCYEVWGLCLPNAVVVIDDVITLKQQMLECFQFANAAINYTHATIGLSMYRSRLLGAGLAQHVEAFTEMPAKEYIALVERLQSCDDTFP